MFYWDYLVAERVFLNVWMIEQIFVFSSWGLLSKWKSRLTSGNSNHKPSLTTEIKKSKFGNEHFSCGNKKTQFCLIYFSSSERIDFAFSAWLGVFQTNCNINVHSVEKIRSFLENQRIKVDTKIKSESYKTGVQFMVIDWTVKIADWDFDFFNIFG